MGRRRHEIVTPDHAILPDQAQTVDLTRVKKELNSFTERPNMFNVEPLVRGLVQEAFPDHSDAPAYFISGSIGGRRLEDQINRFPLFPLSRMGDFDHTLVSVMQRISYPSQRYSMGAADTVNDLIARSDSPYAHEALRTHVVTPFPEERQSVSDGPDEMSFKTGMVKSLFDAVTYHGTPDLNPYATQTLADIYRAAKPGGFAYEWAMHNEEERIKAGKKRPYFERGQTLDGLRSLQDTMLSRFITCQHDVFDAAVYETLESEPSDHERLLVVAKTMVRGRLPKRDDGYYEDIISLAIAPYDQGVAELVKAKAALLERGREGSEQEHAMIDRALSRAFTHTEMKRHNGPNTDNFRSSKLLTFGVELHPLSSTHLESQKGGGLEWTRTPNYYEDMQYLAKLVAGPNTDGIRGNAAWHIAKSFEHDYSYDDKPRRAARAYMLLADAALSADPNDYARIRQDGMQSVMDAMNHILSSAPNALDHLNDDQIVRLMTYREAYAEFVQSVYPEGKDHRPAPGAPEAEWGQFHGIKGLEGDFEAIARKFGERLTWQEIQTNPKRYIEYVTAALANYTAYFASQVSADGSHASREQRKFSTIMQTCSAIAQSFLEQDVHNDVNAAVVRMVGFLSHIRQEGYKTDLRYNSDFHLNFSSLVLELQSNMPLRLQAMALQLIEEGTMHDFMRDEDKPRIRRRIARLGLK